MTIERTESGAVVITGPHIKLAQLIVWKHALKLEMLGMKRRGCTVNGIIKKELGFTGDRQAVLAQLEEHIANWRPE